MTRILIVCLGNICRSPAAEGVMRTRARERGMKLYIESAGTGGWHVGDPPDARMIAAMGRHKMDISHQRAQQLDLAHFYTFDYVLAMDMSNQEDILSIAPPNRECDIRLFLDFANGDVREMPDPYYGGQDGFEKVINLIEQGTEGFLDFLEGEID